MKRFFILFFVIIILSPEFVEAETSHLRFLAHGHSKNDNIDIGDIGNLGVTGWLIAPSLGDAPDKWIGLVGPRFDTVGFNVELLVGAMISGGEKKYILDSRFELTPKLWNLPLYIWGEIQAFDLSEEINFYSFLQIDYVLPFELGMIGIESENVHLIDNTDDLSVGVHFVLPVSSNLVFVVAYQFHDEGSQQFWVRAVINLWLNTKTWKGNSNGILPNDKD